MKNRKEALGAGRNLTGSFLFIRKNLSPYNEEVNLSTFKEDKEMKKVMIMVIVVMALFAGFFGGIKTKEKTILTMVSEVNDPYGDGTCFKKRTLTYIDGVLKKETEEYSRVGF